MCSEGLLLTYITICDFTCIFICRNEVVFGICAESYVLARHWNSSFKFEYAVIKLYLGATVQVRHNNNVKVYLTLLGVNYFGLTKSREWIFL